MINDFVRALQVRLQEDLTAEKDGLARGAAATLGDYKYTCGVIRGLELASQHARDLLAAHEDDDKY
jgi:hypothetical protein